MRIRALRTHAQEMPYAGLLRDGGKRKREAYIDFLLRGLATRLLDGRAEAAYRRVEARKLLAQFVHLFKVDHVEVDFRGTL